ncbi:MAG: toprim domain-containing protein [Cyclobacteriaceae bacterium]|nr:toprim domain-containing protein [Cyclobacteriaceae bacterium]
MKNEAGRKPFDIRDFYVVAAKLSDLGYLTRHRGLHVDTLSVFQPFIRLVKPVWSDSLPFNIGFPSRIPGKDDIAGFELVNYMYKGQAKGSDKTNSLWGADISQTGRFVGHIYIAESAIDAMSFYQLFRHKLALDQATFYSTGGYVTDRQLRNLFTHHPNALVHTLFDNDLAGHLYDIRTACMKENRSLLIRKDGDTVHFSTDSKSFSLPAARVSLTNFRLESGLRPDIRVHKAQGKDFNEMVMNRASGLAASVRMR